MGIIRYDGNTTLEGIPFRDQLVEAACTDDTLSGNGKIEFGQPIHFMPVDVEDRDERQKGKKQYVLRLYGPLEDGTKICVKVTDISVFFDIRVPKSVKDISRFKKVIKRFLTAASINATLKEHDAYPLREYHPSMVAYVRITTNTLANRRRAIDLFKWLQLSTIYEVQKCLARGDTENADKIVVNAIMCVKEMFRTNNRTRLNAAADSMLNMGDPMKSNNNTNSDAPSVGTYSKEKSYLELASDDSKYHRKASREYKIPLANWLVLSNYKRVKEPRTEKVTTRCKHLLTVNIKDVEGLNVKNDPSERVDRTLILTWDIEAYSPMGHLPTAACAKDEMFMICMTVHWKDSPKPLKQICITTVKAMPDDQRWLTITCDSEASMIQAFGKCWGALAPDIQIGFNDSCYDWLFLVERAKQYNILHKLWNDMTSRGRNVNGTNTVYRWDFHGKKNTDNITKWVIALKNENEDGCEIKIHNGEEDIKITPTEYFKSSFLKIPGCIPLDVRVCYKKIYPRSEVQTASSLKFYLEVSGLEGKEDMPINCMWKIYEKAKHSATPVEEMRKVAEYCMVDALRCQELLVHRSVITDYREISTYSYVSLYDSCYNAGGVKVCNLLGAYAKDKQLLLSMCPKQRNSESKGSYPGAHVFPPEKGVECKRPVTGLDYASLYTSIFMALNISPEKIVRNSKIANKLRESGENLHEIDFDQNGKNVHAWVIRHNNVPEKMGLYPVVLIDLLKKRTHVKSRLKILIQIKQRLEYVISMVENGAMDMAKVSDELSRNGLPMLDEIRNKILGLSCKDDLVSALKLEYGAICFKYACVNAKQNALKIFMNTFYGETGNDISPFFLVEIAGGITSAGQMYIKEVADFLKKRDFRIKYGDTDSLYLVCPDGYYKECDKEYNEGNIEIETYWANMVKVTMEVMNGLCVEVNLFIQKLTKTSFLKMAYEGVYFPIVFTGKKKYFGVLHSEEPNFHPAELYIKGIDVVKQGQSEIFRNIGHRIMWSAVAIPKTLDDEISLSRVVLSVLDDIYKRSNEWDYSFFVQTMYYNKDKNNITLKQFKERMENKHKIESPQQPHSSQQLWQVETVPLSNNDLYKIPEPGERFQYVIVKVDDFDMYGRKKVIKKSDKMEYPEVAKFYGMEIDLGYYLINQVAGLCARFINYETRFQPTDVTRGTGDNAKAIDILSQKSAKKFLEKHIKDMDKQQLSSFAKKRQYTQVYKNTIKEAQRTLLNEYGHIPTRVLHNRQLCYELYIGTQKDEGCIEIDVNGLLETIEHQARCQAQELYKNISPNWCEKVAYEMGIDNNGFDITTEIGTRSGTNRLQYIRAIQDVNQKALYNPTGSILDQYDGDIRRALRNILPTMQDIAMKYKTRLRNYILTTRKQQENPNGGIQYTEVSIVLSNIFTQDEIIAMTHLWDKWCTLVNINLIRIKEERLSTYWNQLTNP